MIAQFCYDSDQTEYSNFSDWICSLDLEKPLEIDIQPLTEGTVNIIDELGKKDQRNVISTFTENRVLNIDITHGIDNIVKIIHDNADNIDNVVIYADNANYDGLSKLKKLGKEIKISYIHNEMTYREPITIDEFINMRQYINSIVQVIKEQQLTPVEEILALYETIKWYRYNYDENNPDNSRYIHSFVEKGEIVCAGYSKLFAQIAKELGHNAFVCLINSTDTKTGIGHERNAIYINDDHYNIHGLYYLDITFDSTQLDTIGNKYGDDVQKSNLFYQCFLFNYEQYINLFPDEYNPVSISDINRIIPFVQNNFSDIKEEDLVNNSPELSMQIIKTIYRNVMLKQKINHKQIDELLSNFDEHNRIQQQILEDNGSNSKGFRH